MEHTDLGVKDSSFTLSPLVDIVFKAIFGNPKNKDILSSLIKAVLNTEDSEFNDLEITDTNLKIQNKDGKVGILDVKVYTKNRKIVNVEMQVLPVPELRERIIFYSSKMITEQIGSGEDYEHIHRVISIIILNYNFIKENGTYHHVFQLYEKNMNVLFSEILEIHTLELPKLPKEDENRKLLNWLNFFKAKKKGEFEMLAVKSPELQKAYEELKQISQDPVTKELYESRLKEQRDWISRMKGAERKGLEKGMEKGIKAFIADKEEDAVPQDRIVEKLQKHYELDEALARSYYLKYKS